MLESFEESGVDYTRRQLIAGLSSIALLPLTQASGHAASSRWPPVFETARSQFTLLEPREKMPKLRLKDINNRMVVGAAIPGRITLVNIWATWCGACRIDLPLIAKLQRDGISGLDVIAICTDGDDLDKVKVYLADIGEPNLKSLIAPSIEAKDWRSSSIAAFKAYGMPITYLVGETGYIEGFITGAADWMSPAGIRLIRYYQSDQAK